MSNADNRFENEVSFEGKAIRVASIIKKGEVLSHLCPLCLHKKIRGKNCSETPRKKRRK